jgi:hypothetical protein
MRLYQSARLVVPLRVHEWPPMGHQAAFECEANSANGTFVPFTSPFFRSYYSLLLQAFLVEASS